MWWLTLALLGSLIVALALLWVGAWLVSLVWRQGGWTDDE